MEDLVGLRVVVPDASHQQDSVDRLATSLSVKRIHDYRDPDREYRAVHVVVSDGPRLVEVQVRTVAQQLWANESESFGETVKEGGGDQSIRSYLRELASICYAIDQGQHPASMVSPLLITRQTVAVRLPVLRALHQNAIRRAMEFPCNAYVVVYDGDINQCTQILPYLPDEHTKALEDYTTYARTLDEDRYEVLILNAASEHSVQITHGRFFPEGMPTSLLETAD
jgi:hypothetical protein